jgi:hypothetical protein
MFAKTLSSKTLRGLFFARMKQGAIVEVSDYEEGDIETKNAEKLTNTMWASSVISSKITYHASTNLAADLYSVIKHVDTSKEKNMHWLLYGGYLSICLQRGIRSILQGDPGLLPDSTTFITLPLFAINKRIFSDDFELTIRYKNERSIPELLAEHSQPDLLHTGLEPINGVDEHYFAVENRQKARIIIRKDGRPLRILNPDKSPSFIMDFFTVPAALEKYGFIN